MSWWQFQSGPRVVLVGHHNLCRSPMAEALLRQKVALLGISSGACIESVGTHVIKGGARTDPRVAQVLAPLNIPVKRRRGRLLDVKKLRNDDFILAMDQEILAYLKLLMPEELLPQLHLVTDWCRPLRGQDIPDPYLGSLSGFERVRDMLEVALNAFVWSNHGVLEECLGCSYP